MRRLTLLQLNDLHGYLLPHPELIRRSGEWEFAERGGLARIATLFKRVCEKTEGAVIVLDNGDTFHGTHVAVTSQGMALVPAMNALGIDAMTLHWEFAYTPDGVRRLAGKLGYPMVAVNCFLPDGTLAFEPYVMLDRGGLKVAVIGLACPIVDKTMPPAFSRGLRFSTGHEELPGWIHHARQDNQADLVVLLSHAGFPQDVKLAQTVPGIDVILSGHTHNRLKNAARVGETLIIQSGCHGSFVGRLELEVENRRVVAHRYQLVEVDAQLPEDAQVQRLVETALASDRPALSDVVGEVASPLSRYDMLYATMDDVLLQAISEVAGTSLAFSNGWRYGAPIPAGLVTENDLWNIIPGNPPVSVVELSGLEIWQMLEENLERTFARDPFDQMGGYLKRVRGLRLYFKAENPPGYRIDRIFADGEALDLKRMYRAAFVTAQGVPEKFGRKRQHLDVTAVEALRRLFATHRPVCPATHPNVTEV